MAKIHERIAEFAITLNAAADTLTVNNVRYYRDDAQLAASTPFELKFTAGSAQTSPSEVTLGELMPPPYRFRFTFANF